MRVELRSTLHKEKRKLNQIIDRSMKKGSLTTSEYSESQRARGSERCSESAREDLAASTPVTLVGDRTGQDAPVAEADVPVAVDGTENSGVVANVEDVTGMDIKEQVARLA